jgi:hypothetical protein
LAHTKPIAWFNNLGAIIVKQIYGYTETGVPVYPAYLAVKITVEGDGIYFIARATGDNGNSMGNIVLPREEVPRLIASLTSGLAELRAIAGEKNR